MTSFHAIIGAGATGTATARLLAEEGTRVKIITRSGSGPTDPNIELVAADATDESTLIAHTAGAEVIYNCANPQYHTWSTDWPPLAAAILSAAIHNNAVLVTLNNLYGYAKPTAPMRASDAFAPPSVKGAVRAQMWHDALAAHDAGLVRVTEARASDFIGPDVGESAHMGDRVVPRLLKGKSVSLLGDTDAAHSWTAIGDVARTLVTLGRDSRAWGRAWHVPSVAPLTQRELVHELCDVAGVEPVKVSTIPKPVVSLLGLFIPAMRELKEVAYQFEAPFIMDSAETTAIFGLEPTPLRETLQATIGSYSPAHAGGLAAV